MKIILYNSSAENNRLDKSNYLNGLLTLEGTLRERCSILQPSILLNIIDYDAIVEQNNIDVQDSTPDDIVMSLINRIVGCNYVYIPDFKRYYFVQDIVSEGKFLWRLNLSVDTLMSFKDEIKSQEAMIARNENDYNDLIADNQVSFENDKAVTYEAVSNSLDCKTFNVSSMGDNDVCFVVSTICAHPTPSGSQFDSTADGNLPALNKRRAGILSTMYWALAYPDMLDFAWTVFDSETRRSFIKAIVCLPFEVNYEDDGEQDRYITLGHEVVTITHIEGVQIGNNIPKPFVPNRVKFADFTFKADATSFTEQNPYTRYFLYIPYLGYRELESVYLGDRIQVFYTVNYEDGSATVIVYNKTKEQTLIVSSCQVGIIVGLSTTTSELVREQKLSLGISTAISSITSILSMAGGAMTSNPLAIAGGAISLGGTVANAISSNAQLHDSGSIRVSDGVQGLITQQKFFLRVEKMIPVNNTSNKQFVGKPLNDKRTLSNLTGFTQVSEIHLEGFDNATATEINQIEALLKSGIII